jgi:pimeloyl-ACP methyl ester carboxylesterase
MIEEPRGLIDYHESGEGPTVVLVPGSCSTGAAWRSVIEAWKGQFRCVTTSLLGYGGTRERRSSEDYSIALEAEVVEAVVRRAGGRVHLVGHSFGGLVSVVVALRRQVPIESLTILEAPAAELLAAAGELDHYGAFRRMTEAYFQDHDSGNREAIAAMIDFYGGVGTFASFPPRVKDYVVETTPANVLDWASAYGYPLSPAQLAAIYVPSLVIWGGNSHPAAKRANDLLAEHIPAASRATIDDAAHFMIATHASDVARLVSRHIVRQAPGSQPYSAVGEAVCAV